MDDVDRSPTPRETLARSSADIPRQIAFSAAFGLVAFIAFCVLRPRWTSLYSARKKRKAAASNLPPLPKSFLGWIPVVYNITEEEVLESAGLDAFVFLAFLKMVTKYVAFLLFFALIVVYPVYKKDEHDRDEKPEDPTIGIGKDKDKDNHTLVPEKGHDWTQFIFAYLYTFVAVYIILKETQRMIRIRQKYLADQSSISDRTIRLSGIPVELRDEGKIKETIENLEIGRVESVTLCRHWGELDRLMEERSTTLRRLEESWSVYLGTGNASRKMRRRYRGEEEPAQEEEQSGLLSGDEVDHGTHVAAYNKARPQKRIWYGFMSLQHRKVDAIDYYEERLRRLDERIKISRKKEYAASSLAFITLDSTAACQMACQAILDPQPMQLIASPSPAPTSIIWRNTYLSRRNRMTRAWTVTAFIVVLTVVWSFLLVPLAGVQTMPAIKAVLPDFAKWLKQHKTASWLVNSGVPTLLVALLNVAVPYVYEFLSYRQGMTSMSDIEMSLISKNFFFTFFNLLIVFTVLNSTISAAAIWNYLKKSLRDLEGLPRTLFDGLVAMTQFYINYLVLQTLGLFPFRLLQFGSVSLYPIYRMMAKTPRDYSELAQPSTFTYGFFIPQVLFTLIICVVYCCLSDLSVGIELLGLLYFAIGSFIYKYQLLYAMDHRQFSTGKAWPMMCLRFVIGLILFQLVAIGNLLTDEAWIRGGLIVPLVIATIWFAMWYKRTYEPLMKNIALRTLREVHETRMEESILSGGEEEERPTAREPRTRNRASRFINPSLTAPLEEPWIARTTEREAELGGNEFGGHSNEDQNA